MDTISAQQLRSWVQSFSEQDLQKQGWRVEPLIESCLQKKWVARWVDHKIASFISYHEISPILCEILFLATSPPWQKQGFMTQLLDEFLHQNRGREVWLECREDNLSARHLYLKKGFHERGRRNNYYKDGSAAILFNYLPD